MSDDKVTKIGAMVDASRSEPSPLAVVDATQAAAIYSALEVAIEFTEPKIGQRQNASIRRALQFQVSTWEAEKARLATAFPTLTDAVS